MIEAAKSLPMQARIWARVLAQGAHILRRGAWYNVIREPKNGIVLLEVNKHIVPMNEQFVSLKREKPSKWSVVSRDPMDYATRRASMARFPYATYAVCPRCRTRATIDRAATDHTCAHCGDTYEVDWGDPC